MAVGRVSASGQQAEVGVRQEESSGEESALCNRTEQLKTKKASAEAKGNPLANWVFSQLQELPVR